MIFFVNAMPLFCEYLHAALMIALDYRSGAPWPFSLGGVRKLLRAANYCLRGGGGALCEFLSPCSPSTPAATSSPRFGPTPRFGECSPLMRQHRARGSRWSHHTQQWCAAISRHLPSLSYHSGRLGSRRLPHKTNF